MNLKKIHLELEPYEVQQLLSIALDDDKEQALTFVKKTLVKQMEKAMQPH